MALVAFSKKENTGGEEVYVTYVISQPERVKNTDIHFRNL